jgi:selenide,water dikinase
VCASAGIPVAGGHSIDCPEPVYGLAVIGTCRPEHVRRNADVRDGDALILTKPIGVGVYSAAIKKNELGDAGYREMLATTTLLNSVGADLARNPAVHAMTDVTGFGLLGHGLEMARGSRARLLIDTAAVPLLARAAELAKNGFVTGASQRNWTSYGEEVELPTGLPDWERQLLTDPQTSGGLLVSVDAARAADIVKTIRAAGYPAASVIGRVKPGAPGITVAGSFGSARR